MEDSKEKVNNLKFLFYYNLEDNIANSFLSLTSLKTGSQLGLAFLCLTDIIFHIILIANSLRDVSNIYAIIATLLRFAVFIYFCGGIEKNDLDQCLKGCFYLNIATLVILYCCLIALIGCIFGMTIFGFWPYFNLPVIIFLPLGVMLNVYVTYACLSFTKHLAMGNIDLINGKLNLTGYEGVNTLIIGHGFTDDDISSLNRVQFAVLEKIVLNNPLDLTFAQSAQGAMVSGIALPSGIKVPDAREGKIWKIKGNEIVLE
jgi:hypothetical protein